MALMYGRSRAYVKVERRSTFTFTGGLSYIVSISFTLVNFTYQPCPAPVLFFQLYWGSPIGLFGIRDLPYLKAGIQDFKAKEGRDSGWKECTGCGMIEITGLVRDDRIEEPYWGPSVLAAIISWFVSMAFHTSTSWNHYFNNLFLDATRWLKRY